MEKTAILTDSASCLPEQIREEYQIELVPLNIHNKGKTYQDGVDITPEQVYAFQRTDERITTSSPAPGMFLERFRHLAERSREILCLTVASSYSATFSSMKSAIATAKNQLPDVHIELLDCHTGSAAQALVALAAARAASLGQSLNEVIARAKEAVPRVQISLVLDTLKHLERGGRAPKAGAIATSLLKLKPVVADRMGHAAFLGMVRSRAQGIERILSELKQKVDLKKINVIIVHSDLEDEAKRLGERLRSEFECQELYITEVSAVVAAHIGPGSIGIGSCLVG